MNNCTLGQPGDFLQGMCLYLASGQAKSDSAVIEGSEVLGNVVIDPSATIGSNCKIGPNVTVGPGVVIEDGVCVKRSVILEGARYDRLICELRKV